MMKETTKTPSFQYLLGLVPQRNFWTVFKGMPDDSTDSGNLVKTALREFEEETGTSNVLKSIDPETTLRGATTKKDLVIFLQEGSHVTEDCFDIEKVVKIDQGYMKGQPEIISIRWLTLSEAVNGTTDGAKLYPSQKGILEQAESFLQNKEEEQGKKEE